MATYYAHLGPDLYYLHHHHATEPYYAHSVNSSCSDLSPKSEFSEMDEFECGKRAFQLPSLSPLGSDACFKMSAIKSESESPFDDEVFDFEKAPPLTVEKSRAVPTASVGTATASLQTAFCRRPSHQLKMSHSLPAEPTTQLHHHHQHQSLNHSLSFYGNTEKANSVPQIFTENNNHVNHHPQQQQPKNEQNNSSDDAQQMEIYRDLILRHLIQDISTTCAKLGLPTDAVNWTEEHGSRWIAEMCQQFNLSPPRQTYLTGRMLLNMSEREFRQMSPEAGETLYAQLQLWKTAFESYHSQQQSCGGPSSGMTAADNSTTMTSKTSNWSPTSNSSSCHNNSPVEEKKSLTAFNFSNSAEGANNGNLGGFYNNGQFMSSHSELTPQNSYFLARNMPSPCNSEMSSSGSTQEGPDEENLDFPLNILGMQNGIGFCHQEPGNVTDFHVRQSRSISSDDTEPRSPFPRHSGTVHLWHFIRELLDQPKQYGSCVRWVDREEGTFKIESSHHLARFWGQRKNRSQMNYDKLSRSLRQYYKKGIIQKPEKKQRLVYKFLPPYNL